MAIKGYKILPGVAGDERERRYTGGYTTQTYGSHRGTKIDVMQLEFGAHLRARANLERTANDLAQAIQVFAREYLPLANSESAGTTTPRP
jgi:N-formylglutamate amidohydrolase